MNPYSVRVYIGGGTKACARYYDVELYRGNVLVRGEERGSWAAARVLAVVYCREHGLKLFSTDKVGEHHIKS